MMNSVKEMQKAYYKDREILGENVQKEIPAWYFCDNQKDADLCAQLVLKGKKRATSTSKWELTLNNEPIPQAGDLNIVTNWVGEAKCIIRTTAVQILPYRQITTRHAAIEGEGDGSLEYWRKVHWDYYTRVLEGSSYTVHEDMPIVFEQFEVVFRQG